MRHVVALMIAMVAASGTANAQTVDHPLQVGGQVKAPLTLYAPDLKFSKGVLPHGTAPHFTVALVVDQRGLPQNVRMLYGMGEDLDRYALETIRRYRFKPATLNGQPVAVSLNIEIHIDPF